MRGMVPRPSSGCPPNTLVFVAVASKDGSDALMVSVAGGMLAIMPTIGVAAESVTVAAGTVTLVLEDAEGAGIETSSVAGGAESAIDHPGVGIESIACADGTGVA